MILSCIEACSDPDIMHIISVFKTLLNIARIAVPVILIIFIMIDIVKTIASGDVDTKKLSKSIIKRIIAAVVVFLIFPIGNFVLQNLPVSDDGYLSCYNCVGTDADTDSYQELEETEEKSFKIDIDSK